jgi:hypothetical protein
MLEIYASSFSPIQGKYTNFLAEAKCNCKPSMAVVVHEHISKKL